MHAVVVGRFQPLHRGHEALLRRAEAEAGPAGTVTVAIGSSTEPVDARNPFSFEERRAMVLAVLPRARVVGVPDLNDPPRWVPHLLRLTGGADAVFGNDEGTLGLLERTGVRVVRPGLVDRPRLEATRIREQMRSGDPAWHDALPEPVARLLDQWHAVERLRGLA